MEAFTVSSGTFGGVNPTSTGLGKSIDCILSSLPERGTELGVEGWASYSIALRIGTLSHDAWAKPWLRTFHFILRGICMAIGIKSDMFSTVFRATVFSLHRYHQNHAKSSKKRSINITPYPITRIAAPSQAHASLPSSFASSASCSLPGTPTSMSQPHPINPVHLLTVHTSLQFARFVSCPL